MRLVIEIEVENDAFQDAEGELPRILQDLAERVPEAAPYRCDGDYSLHDSNGNWVGYARFVRGTIKGSR